ncbi:MAG: ABC transporter permease [Firmicutes bacterium]|nr:ABC transporter permease [Bacillota bacterium]
MNELRARIVKLPLYKKVCLAILALYLVIAIFAPAIMPYAASDFSHRRLAPPGRAHLLGTNELGHDIFSLLINGFRITISLALVAGFATTTLGTALAFISVYFGGLIDDTLHFIANLFLMVPELVVIMFVAVFAAPTLSNTVIAIVLFSWVRVYKIVRAKLLDCLKKDRVIYTLSLKGNFLDVARVLAPDVLPIWGSFFVIQCNRAVMYETTLSFFGIGDPLAKPWGKLIKSAMDYSNLYYDNVFLWYLLPPVLVVLGFVICLALLVTQEE